MTNAIRYTIRENGRFIFSAGIKDMVNTLARNQKKLSGLEVSFENSCVPAKDFLNDNIASV